MSRSQPMVSVVIPTYNRGNAIRRAINSVLSQTYQQFEILVVDDNSTDETHTFFQNLDDPRIRYYRHSTNLGPSAARNTGLRYAKCPYVAFLDSDDEWLPLMLEKCLSKFQQNEDIGVVYFWGGARQVDGSLKVVNKFSISGEMYKEALMQGYVSHAISMVIKRECFDKIGLWDANLRAREDNDISIRLAKEYRFELIPEILAVIHLDARVQTTMQEFKTSAFGYIDLFTKHESEIRKMCGDAVMAKHWIRCGKHALRAKDKNTGVQLFNRAHDLNPCWQYRMYMLFARQLQWLVRRCNRFL